MLSRTYTYSDRKWLGVLRWQLLCHEDLMAATRMVEGGEIR